MSLNVSFDLIFALWNGENLTPENERYHLRRTCSVQDDVPKEGTHLDYRGYFDLATHVEIVSESLEGDQRQVAGWGQIFVCFID